LKESVIMAAQVEGYKNAEWILMDYMDFVIHIFSRNARAYYDLERLWRDGTRLTTSVYIQKSSDTPGLAKIRSTD